MKNSPTLCQLFVDNALWPIRAAWPFAIIYHYMDDILIAQEKDFAPEQFSFLSQELQKQGLIIAPEKIQSSPPWTYLGWKISDSQVRPQKLEITTSIKTLKDGQKLLGNLQWLQPVIGISNDDLDILRPLLKGTDPAAPVMLSAVQLTTMQKIARQVTERWVDWLDPNPPVDLTIFNGPSQLIGALTQCKKKKGERVRILEWLFTRIQPRKSIEQKLENLADLIRKGRTRIMQITGKEPGVVRVPLKKDVMDWCLQHSEELQVSLLTTGQNICVEPLKSMALQWVGQNSWIIKPKRSETPLQNAVTAFTDAEKKSRRAVVTWMEDGAWRHHLLEAVPGDSLQMLELAAVVWAVLRWRDQPLNVVTDSLYVAGVLQVIEDARLRDTKNPWLNELFRQLQTAIQQRQGPYAVIHIRSHTWSQGLGKGNQRADQLVATAVPLSDFVKAREAQQYVSSKCQRVETTVCYLLERGTGYSEKVPRMQPSWARFGNGDKSSRIGTL